MSVPVIAVVAYGFLIFDASGAQEEYSSCLMVYMAQNNFKLSQKLQLMNKMDVTNTSSCFNISSCSLL